MKSIKLNIIHDLSNSNRYAWYYRTDEFIELTIEDLRKSINRI